MLDGADGRELVGYDVGALISTASPTTIKGLTAVANIRSASGESIFVTFAARAALYNSLANVPLLNIFCDWYTIEDSKAEVIVVLPDSLVIEVNAKVNDVNARVGEKVGTGAYVGLADVGFIVGRGDGLAEGFTVGTAVLNR
jgi:hypothetical protein